MRKLVYMYDSIDAEDYSQLIQQNKIYCELGSDCWASFFAMDYWGDDSAIASQFPGQSTPCG